MPNLQMLPASCQLLIDVFLFFIFCFFGMKCMSHHKHYIIIKPINFIYIITIYENKTAKLLPKFYEKGYSWDNVTVQ